MTAAIIVAVVITVAVLAGLAHRKRAEVVEASLKPPMTFPVTPSEGDRYATAQARWVYRNGWTLE